MSGHRSAKLRVSRRRSAVPTRERILDEAERLIGELGIDDLRLRDVADAIGIQVPSIYGHFGGRDGILAGIADRYVELLASQFPYDGVVDPTKALMDGIEKFVRDLVAHPAYPRLKLRDLESPTGLLAINASAGGNPAENLVAGPVTVLYRRLQKILERGFELGDFRKVELVPFLACFYGSMLVSLTWPTQEVLQQGEASPELERIIRDLQDIAYRIVRAD